MGKFFNFLSWNTSNTKGIYVGFKVDCSDVGVVAGSAAGKIRIFPVNFWPGDIVEILPAPVTVRNIGEVSSPLSSLPATLDPMREIVFLLAARGDDEKEYEVKVSPDLIKTAAKALCRMRFPDATKARLSISQGEEELDYPDITESLSFQSRMFLTGFSETLKTAPLLEYQYTWKRYWSTIIFHNPDAMEFPY